MLLAAMVLLVICGVWYLLLPKSEKKTPAAENPAVESQPAVETPVPQTTETAIIEEVNTEEPAEENATLRLSPASHTYLPVERTQPEVSYSQKKNHNARKITPGVTYKPGEGINVKVDEDEKIQIGRDSTYRSGEYQVRWKKTF